MSEERALTVTEAMNSARLALEKLTVSVIGEVSEFNDKPGYKAAYFTVCDEGASMPCMMWRDAYNATGVQLQQGALVEMTGQFTAYIPKGRMQFRVKRLALAGEGALRMKVAQLARKLESEGLMRTERKRSLIGYPERIAVVTSPRGKAIHDVIRTLGRRYPMAELLVAGVPVEGAGAPRALVEGIEAAVAAEPDVILLVRGGGSYEDLMPFNAEEVARAVVASPVPIVTGIGHEPDTSIADMVSDVRASTPTAAAEAAAPSMDEISQRIDKTSRLLGNALSRKVQDLDHRFRLLGSHPVFVDPDALLAATAQTLDTNAQALQRAIPERIRRDEERLGSLLGRFEMVARRAGDRDSKRLEQAKAQLEALSPMAVLGRGYSVCFGPDGRSVIKSTEQVGSGDLVSVHVADGNIGCVVETIERKSGDE